MTTEPTVSPSTRQFVNWRTAGLLGACAAGGLTLNMMVLASAPAAPIADEPQAQEIVAPESIAAPLAASDTGVPAPAVVDTLSPVDEVPTSTAVEAAESAPVTAPASVPAPAPATPAAAPAAPALAPAPAAPASAPVPVAVTAPPVTAPPATAPPATAPRTTRPVVTAPPTTARPATTTATTTTTTTAITPATTAAPPADVTYPLYTVRGVAQIYLTFTDGATIEVYSVVGEANWVYQVDKNGPRSIEVKFFNVETEREAEFHAELEGGSIKVEKD